MIHCCCRLQCKHLCERNQITLLRHRITPTFILAPLFLILYLVKIVTAASVAVTAPTFSNNQYHNNNINMLDDMDQTTNHVRYIQLPDVSILEETLHIRTDDNDNITDNTANDITAASNTTSTATTEVDDICRRMVIEELSIDEQMIAAYTSYAFWGWEQYMLNQQESVINKTLAERNAASSSTVGTISNRTNISDEQPKMEFHLKLEVLRIQMACREARRHYIGQNHNYQLAVETLKQTIQWRKESKVDLLKVCFAPSKLPDTNMTIASTTNMNSQYVMVRLSDEELSYCTKYEQVIENDLNQQTMVLRGYDVLNRPILIRYPRHDVWTNPSTAEKQDVSLQNTDQHCNQNNSNDNIISDSDKEMGFFWAQIYMAERATAIAEIQNLGNLQSEQMTVVLNFQSYNSNHAPPINVVIRTISLLQQHYPERLGKAIVLDAPFWMTTLMTIIHPFLSSKTRDKLIVQGSSMSLSSLLRLPFTSSAVAPSGDNTDTHQKREELMRSMVSVDQAMPFMILDGQLTSTNDIDYQIRIVPFYELYDYATRVAS